MASAAAMVMAACAMGCGGASARPTDPGVVVLEGALGNEFVASGASTEVIGRIRVGTTPLSRATRPAINVALVVDTSGSMMGEPIEHARAASLAFLQALEEGDRFALVAFHSRTEVLLPSTTLDGDSIDEAREAIGRIEAQGTTDMAGGLTKGLEQVIGNFRADGINRVVLLGDGVPNDPAGIEAMAQAAGERGIAITSLGLGLEFDEQLMGRIAALSHGAFHYIEEPEQVATVFTNEVLRMERVFGRNAVVTLQPGPGVQITSVVGRDVQGQNGALSVMLGDLVEGEQRDLMVRMTAPGRREGATIELLDATLSFDDAVDDAGRLERHVFLGAHSTTSQEQIAEGRNEEVIHEAEQLQASAVTVQAIGLARNGDVETARRILSEAETRVREVAASSGDVTFVQRAEQMRSLQTSLPAVAPGAQSAGGGSGGVTVEGSLDEEPAAPPPAAAERAVRGEYDRAMSDIY